LAKAIVTDTTASSSIWLDDKTILYISTKNGESTLRTYNTKTDMDNKAHSFGGAIGELNALTIDKETVRFAFSTKVTPHGAIVRANETDIPQTLVYDRL
jgi:hypothetical protein